MNHVAAITELADAASASGAQFDPRAEPPAATCSSCDAPTPWVWLDPATGARARGAEPGPATLAFRPRWRPPAEQCAPCAQADERAELALEVTARMRTMGIDVTHSAYSWERHIKQRVGEDRDTFRARWRASDPHTIGITAHNWHAALLLRDWTPERPHWVYVSGKPGSGKSLFMALLIRELLSVPSTLERTTVERGGRVYSAVRRRGGWPVAYAMEGELRQRWERWKQRGYRSDDPSPLAVLELRGVLCLDDLGAGSDGAQKAWRYEVAQAIDYRYRHRLPTVIASNYDTEQVGELYGSARMTSRLHGMVGDTECTLDTAVDWRAR